MENSEQQNKVNQPNKFGSWIRTSITARMIIVGVLIMILLIPLTYVNMLIEERAYRQQDVIREINSKWGNEVIIYGPILKVPYKTYSETSTYNEKSDTFIKETKTHTNYAYVFPEILDANADVKSKTLYLGNFESAVFTSKTQLKGRFNHVDLSSKDINKEDILWEKASVIFKTTNLKGIKTEMEIRLNDQRYTFETNFVENKNRSNYLDELETGFLEGDILRDSFQFDMNMTYDGSKQIQLIPVGKTTTMHMNSNWEDPGFIGNYSPNDETRNITENGFEVDWKVLSINRAFSQI